MLMAENAPNRIAEAREKSGLKRYDVAARLRVSENTVYNWETGRVDTVPDKHKLALAEMFGCSVAWLMKFPDRPANGNGS
jgi:DNA-binding transcriptional regulator YiaG